MTRDESPFTVAVADRYNASRPSKGIWRIRARNVIVDVISEVRDDLGTTPITRKEALAFIDDAYPFGERAMAPYKAWLAERKLFVAAFDEPQAFEGAPDEIEIAACDVARDYEEENTDKSREKARALVEEMAPNRLARKCPACDAKPGEPCIVIAEGGWPPLVVPHAARLAPPAPPSGPLFATEVA